MSYEFGEPHPKSKAERSSTQKRRHQTYSDEEIWEQMDKRGLSYRLGHPRLPELPVRVVTPTTRLVDEEKVLEMAKNILSSNNIASTEIHIDLRIPYSAKPQDYNSYMTLLVLLDTEKYSRTLLETVVKDIRQYLKGGGALEALKIEFLDFRAYRDLWSLPLGPKDSIIVDQWPTVLKSLITELARLQQSWLTIELCRRGLYNDAKRSPLTAVITTNSAEDDGWWTDILPILRNCVASPFVLQYEVRYGSSLYSMDSDWKSRSGHHISEASYGSEVRMGSSIGITKNPIHAGTAGGVVTLGKKGSYALTNFHVATDDRIDKLTEGKSLPPNSKELQKNPHLFMSPSDTDHSAYIARLQSGIKTFESYNSPVDPETKQLIDGYAAKIANAQGASREFGTLLAGSGRMSFNAPKYMTDEQTGRPRPPPSGEDQAAEEYIWLMDWALIQFAKGRSQVNRMSKADFITSNVSRDIKTNFLPGIPANNWTSLNAGACNLRREDVKVAKYGRTSGWSFGQINHAITAINLSKEFKHLAEQYGYTNGRYGHVWSVMKRHHMHDPFLTRGDSGSICVHDPSGAWLGLLFAETSTGSGLMLPIDVVFQDIERVTGEKVTEPKYVVVNTPA
ncbi:hypothetical protein PTNB85_07395 [Pyrenophora teres f. teres]|nr:hypothetical protein HRS9139_07428 [Pyrenophora teres f. teres]KAE8829370.1 hypothetical protein HRS9122_09185 [Pyrenophora teres f. teres]KAE8830808.1 hypothetical protein PTNB85_07395 [Pyrenophora teres f. teres]